MKLNKSDLIQTLQRFQGLSPRERYLSIVAVALAVLYGLYALFYAPLLADKVLLEQKILAQTQVYRYLQTLSAEVLALRSQQQVVPERSVTESLMALVEASSVEMEIKPAIKSIAAEGENKVNISLDDVAFDTLIAWIIDLEVTYGITVTQINTVALAHKKGGVSCQLSLAR